MPIELQNTWGWKIVLALFFCGCSAGTFCTAVISEFFKKEEFEDVSRFGALLSPFLVALGSLFLLLDLGRPIRGLILFRAFTNTTSWMAIGAWILFAFLVITLIYSFFWMNPENRYIKKMNLSTIVQEKGIRRAIGVGGLFVALMVAIYTGLLLQGSRFRPFWDTFLLPTLFVVSAMSTGIALVGLYPFFNQTNDKKRRMIGVAQAFGKVDAVLIILELIIIGGYLMSMWEATPETKTSVAIITSGKLSLVFWGGLIFIGLALPLFLFLFSHTQRIRYDILTISFLGGLCILAGGVIMRHIILAAGLPISLSSLDIEQILQQMSYIL